MDRGFWLFWRDNSHALSRLGQQEPGQGNHARGALPPAQAGVGAWRLSGANENLLIQGDKLLALKALIPFYAGRVKSSSSIRWASSGRSRAVAAACSCSPFSGMMRGEMCSNRSPTSWLESWWTFPHAYCGCPEHALLCCGGAPVDLLRSRFCRTGSIPLEGRWARTLAMSNTLSERLAVSEPCHVRGRARFRRRSLSFKACMLMPPSGA